MDPELRELHRGAQRERERLTPDPDPCPEPESDPYPIIEEGTVIEWLTDMGVPVPDLVKVVGMYADESGAVQLRIRESAPDTKESPRTIALEDLHDQLEWREWADVTDKYENQPFPEF